MQIGRNGTLGIGELTYLEGNKTEMVQVFTQPDGTSYKVGHRSTHIDKESENNSSFAIGNDGEWIPQRTYLWKKQK